MTVKVLVAGDANLDLVLRGDVVPAVRAGRAAAGLPPISCSAPRPGSAPPAWHGSGLDVALVARVGA